MRGRAVMAGIIGQDVKTYLRRLRDCYHAFRCGCHSDVERIMARMRKALLCAVLFAGASWCLPAPQSRVLSFPNAAVVSVDPIASKVGVEILKKGGNAVEAAVAVGFALAVTHPAAGNLGGGGYMMIRLGRGQTICIDYRER